MTQPASTEEVLSRLHPGLQRWLRHESGWLGLSSVQRAAIPPILEGADCVVEAPTAGGKTEAVLFPALTRAATARGPGVRVLYLAPLRALLNNLEGRGERYAELCGLRAFKWHGDVGRQAKIEKFRDPPELLMTTPESVEAILLRRAGWQDLFAGLESVIIDEAHNFAAGPRGGHLLCLLERVEQAAQRPPQRIALSATLGEPAAMLRWLAGTRRAPGRRVLGQEAPRERRFRIHFFERSGESEESPSANGGDSRRFATLCRLLEEREAPDRRPPRSLVFVPSRKSAETLAGDFARTNRDRSPARRIEVRTHHSAVSKFFREEAESLIQVASEDGLHAIISTSTLELGIDIGALDRVIQMDALSSPSSLLQRVGRTGRRPGKPQFFRGLLCRLDDLPVLAATVSLGLQGRSEVLHPPRRAFHLLAHQLLCLALQELGIRRDRAWAILRGADCFSGVAQGEVELLVEHMARKGYLRRADGLLVAGEASERSFLHSNWRRLFAVFDSAPLYEVRHRRQQVGTLDARFVEALEVPFFFVLGGKLWRADRVEVKGRVVAASPSQEGTAPAWLTFGGPDVPLETAEEAGRLLHDGREITFLDDEAQAAFERLRRMHSEDGWSPGALSLQVSKGASARLVTFAGDRINRSLARYLSLRNVGKASANYTEIEVKRQAEKGKKQNLEAALRSALEDLRTGPWADLGFLTQNLEHAQPLWPFSPFAPCLPRGLWASALVEQSLDPEGLLGLMQGRPKQPPRSRN